MRMIVLPALLLALATALSAEEVSGRVSRVTDDEAVVELPSGSAPSPGDRVVVGWILEGLDDFVEARKGRVKEVGAGGIVVELEPGEAPVKAGYVAKVTLTPAATGRDEGASIRVVEPEVPSVEVEPADLDDEMGVIITLLTLGMAQDEWKAQDTDGNGLLDHWTRDVAGLYYHAATEGDLAGMIDPDLARADKAGYAAWGKGEPVPYRGYWFSVIRADAAGRPYAQAVDAAGVPSTHPSSFAVCAWPAKHGGATRFTYIVNERMVAWRKDRGAATVDRVDAWPKGGPVAEGWEECEGIMVTRPLEEEDHPRK